MTNEKARDLFSAYHEGSLEPGLRPSFEQTLASDPALREEYARFEATIGRLVEMRDAPIQIPFDLNERIGARLDRHIWERKQAAPSGIFGRLRTFAFAGLAVLALASAVISIRHFSTGSTPAGLAPAGTLDSQLSVVVKHDALMVTYAPATQGTVTFRIEPDDKVFETVAASRAKPLNRRVSNPNPGTEVISIQVVDRPALERVVLALPGSRLEQVKAGSGTLEEFAKALAGRYRSPVKISGVDPLTQVSWDFNAIDAQQAAEAALQGGHFSVDVREGNLVTISQG